MKLPYIPAASCLTEAQAGDHVLYLFYKYENRNNRVLRLVKVTKATPKRIHIGRTLYNRKGKPVSAYASGFLLEPTREHIEELRACQEREVALKREQEASLARQAKVCRDRLEAWARRALYELDKSAKITPLDLRVQDLLGFAEEYFDLRQNL